MTQQERQDTVRTALNGYNYDHKIMERDTIWEDEDNEGRPEKQVKCEIMVKSDIVTFLGHIRLINDEWEVIDEDVYIVPESGLSHFVDMDGIDRWEYFRYED